MFFHIYVWIFIVCIHTNRIHSFQWDFFEIQPPQGLHSTGLDQCFLYRCTSRCNGVWGHVFCFFLWRLLRKRHRFWHEIQVLCTKTCHFQIFLRCPSWVDTAICLNLVLFHGESGHILAMSGEYQYLSKVQPPRHTIISKLSRVGLMHFWKTPRGTVHFVLEPATVATLFPVDLNMMMAMMSHLRWIWGLVSCF